LGHCQLLWRQAEQPNKTEHRRNEEALRQMLFIIPLGAAVVQQVVLQAVSLVALALVQQMALALVVYMSHKIQE
jgi:hypothetical protein